MACIIGYWWEGVIMGWMRERGREGDCGGIEGDCGIEEVERVIVGLRRERE